MAAGLCYGSRGGGAALAFHHQLGAYDTDNLIGALEGLRRFLGGQKATLVWDGLPARRSQAMGAWLRRQRSWLVVEPLPAYAHDLNPGRALWANLKGVELANLAGEGLDEVIAAVEAWHPADPGHPASGVLVPALLRLVPVVSQRPCHWKERTSQRLIAHGVRGPAEGVSAGTTGREAACGC
jgi:hypothetical protein